MKMSAEVRALSNKLNSFLDIYYQTNFPDKIIFTKDVFLTQKFNVALGTTFKDLSITNITSNFTITDARNVTLGTTTGTMFGTGTTQKIGFLGKTPVARQASIALPTAPSVAYAQAEAQSMKTSVDSIIAVLVAFGFTA